MADTDKVYTPTVIAELPFPQEGEDNLTTSQSTANQIYSPNTTKPKEFPVKRTAVELLSSALNTKSRRILKEFEFTPSGAIQVGNYQDGVSGDIRISPDGIVARDISGNITFSLDGTTGDAVFAGEIRTGSLISGLVTVGDNNVIIDGENRRIIINDGTYDRIIIGYQQNGF